MRSPRLGSWLFSVATLAAGLLMFGASCGQQQEGERCDINNGVSGGDSDCNDNLVCTAAKVLGTDTDRCCPADRSQATVAPCIISSSSIGQDAAAPSTDASVDGSASATDASDASATDAGDAGHDSGTDTGTDSGAADAADSG